MFAHLKNKTDGQRCAPPSSSSHLPLRLAFCISIVDIDALGRYSKDETEKIAFEWQSLLVSAAKGGEPSTYVIEPGIILWSIQVHPPP
jgi:hypothetical protein